VSRLRIVKRDGGHDGGERVSGARLFGVARPGRQFSVTAIRESGTTLR
jgi:hypothetical protein